MLKIRSKLHSSYDRCPKELREKREASPICCCDVTRRDDVQRSLDVEVG